MSASQAVRLAERPVRLPMPWRGGRRYGAARRLIASHSGSLWSEARRDERPRTGEPERRPPRARRRAGSDRRMVREPYRQAFGRARTLTHGRPAGWILLMSAVEKVFFPTCAPHHADSSECGRRSP